MTAATRATPAARTTAAARSTRRARAIGGDVRDGRGDGVTARFIVRREAIVGAASLAFNQHGIRGATLADVATRVGLLKASLNYYYPHKEDLAAECLTQAIAAVREVAVAAREQAGGPERIKAFLTGKAALHAAVASSARNALMSFSEIRALAAPHAERVAQAYAGLFRCVRELVPAAPGFGHDGRNARAYLLLSLANAMPGWLERYEPGDYGRVAGAIAEMVTGGLARSPGDWMRVRRPDFTVAREVPGDRAVQESFLRVATALVNEHGFRGASVDRISSQLNLTKGSFYHHHASKDDLVTQCFERSFDVIRAAQMRAIAATASGAERLDSSVRALVRFQVSAEGPLLRSTARSVLAEAPRRVSLQRGGQLTQRFALFIVDGMAEGALRIVDATLAAEIAALVVNAASSLRWWVPGIGQDDVVGCFVDPMFVGILTPSPQRFPEGSTS